MIDADGLASLKEDAETYTMVHSERVRSVIDQLENTQKIRDQWCEEYTKARDERDSARALLLEAGRAILMKDREGTFDDLYDRIDNELGFAP